MSDTIGEARESNIKPEEEKVEERSSHGFRRRGLLFTLLAMLFVSAAVAIGVGIHVVVAREDVRRGHENKPAVSSVAVPVDTRPPLQTSPLLSKYVRPL